MRLEVSERERRKEIKEEISRLMQKYGVNERRRVSRKDWN